MALSETIDGPVPSVTIVVAGPAAETHVIAIVRQLPTRPQSTAEGVIFWITLAGASLTGKRQLRRLFLDGSDISWGPMLHITDRPDIDAAVAKLVEAWPG